MNSKFDAFLAREKQWKEEFKKLREIFHDCKLSEELKWGLNRPSLHTRP